MEVSEKALVFEKKITATAFEIYQAFTNATKLRHWLCQVSSVDANEDGRIYLAWDNGYYTAGHFLILNPNEKVVFTWFGKDEPHASVITVEITPSAEKHLMKLTHSGMQTSPEWERNLQDIEKGWLLSLDNLVSMLETGIDLRISQRPLLGIFPAVYTRSGEDDPFPLQQGIRIIDVVEGLCAEKGGLKPGDILVDFEGMPTTTWNSLTDAIMQFKAGDPVKVTFYRGADKLSKVVTLSQQAMPDVPDTPAKLAEMLSKKQTEVCDQLMAYLRIISDDEASFKPAGEEWSIKEIIAHFIHNERDQQLWIHNLVQNSEPLAEGEPENLIARVRATVELYPSLPQLLELLRASLKETSTFIANLPLEVVGDKSVFWHLAFVSLESPLHIHSHFDQIAKNLRQARAKNSLQ